MKWPSFLVTNVNGFYVVRNGVCEPVETDRGPYYGVTWNEHEVFVGSNGVDAKLLVFTRALRRVRDIPLRAHYPHQLLWSDGKLLVTMTEENGLGVVNTRCGSVRRVFHTGGKILPGDKYGGIGEDHPNSVWVDRGGFTHVLEHRQSTRFNRPSRISILNRHFALIRRVNVGATAHNVYREGRSFFVCDSANHLFVEIDAHSGAARRSVDLGVFTRGLARTADGFLVGLSDEAPREARGQSASRVAFVRAADFGVEDVLDLGFPGGVHELRLLTAPDPSHNRIVLEI